MLMFTPFNSQDYLEAINPTTSPVRLRILCKNPDKEIRVYAASNVSTPQDCLEDLFKLNDIDLNLSLALNKSCPGHILEELGKTSEPYLLSLICENHSTPEKTLYIIYEKGIRFYIRLLARKSQLSARTFN